MRLRGGSHLVPLLVASALLPAVASAKAAREDHPMVKRFPAAQVTKRSASNLEAYWIPLGRLSGDGQAEKFQVVEGKWTHISYSNPAKNSVIEIGRHYDQLLRDGGFEIVYECRDRGCGQGGRKTNGDWWDPNFQRRYIVGRLARPAGDVWVCVHVQAKGPNTPVAHDVDVIEAKPEPRDMPIARDETSADWMEGRLKEDGRVVLYGIDFDPKRFSVLPAAERTLQAVAQLFANDPQRRLLVVVHTDDLTQWKAGQQRSRKQATMLVSTLVKKHGVPAPQIAGDGVGPLAPASPGPDAPKGAGFSRVELVSLEPPTSPLQAKGRDD